MPLADRFATQLYHVLITTATMLRDRGYVILEPSLLHQMNATTTAKKGGDSTTANMTVPTFAEFKKLVMISESGGASTFISRDAIQMLAVKSKSGGALSPKEAQSILKEYKEALVRVVDAAASTATATPSGISSREIARARAKSSAFNVLLAKYLAVPSSPALEATSVVFMTGSGGTQGSSVCNPSLSLQNVISFRGIAQSRGANRLIVVVGHDVNNANIGSGGSSNLIPPAIRREIETLETTIAVEVRQGAAGGAGGATAGTLGGGKVMGNLVVRDSSSDEDSDDEGVPIIGRGKSGAAAAASSSSTASKQQRVSSAAAEGVTVELFEDSELLLNPLRHSNSPLEHRAITSIAEINALLKERGVESIAQFPRICLSDPLTRYFGLARGSIIETLRQPHEGGVVGAHVMFRQVL